LAGCGSSNSAAQNPDASGAEQKSDEVFKLNIDYPNPENSAIYPVLVDWGEWLAEMSEGRIEVKVYSGGALGSVLDAVTNVETGVTDGCWGPISLHPGQWPLSGVVALPMTGANSMEVMNSAMNDLMATEEFDAEWDNVHRVAFHVTTPAAFIFKDRVDSMQAIVNKTIRTNCSEVTPWLENLGSIPVSVSSNEGYEAISKGTVQGGLWWMDQLESNALYEVVDTVIYGPVEYCGMFLCINKDLYESMPADLQQLIDESGDYYMSLLPDAYYSQEERVIGLLEENDVDLIYTSDEDKEWLAASAQVSYDVYIESMNELGYDGQAVYESLLEKIEHYNEEYAK
jgi:TRAP-type C4-dicarboxylate transport system substrate-binding protein